MTLDSEQLSIIELLQLGSTGHSNSKLSPYNRLLVPPYQRPYCWDEETCEVLWNDILDFRKSAWNAQDNSMSITDNYFVGTIVASTDSGDNKTLDIIDGQQRLTTFLLLLRAILRKFEHMYEDKAPRRWDHASFNTVSDVEKCLWDTTRTIDDKDDHKLYRHPDANLRLHSEVVFDGQRAELERILNDGPDPEAKPKGNDKRSPYMRNYDFFCRSIDKLLTDEDIKLADLGQAISRCVTLLIRCDDLNSALTIFGTLNTRGIPLEDADIFKAELYGRLNNDDEKKQFANEWRDLDQRLKGCNLSMTDIFRDYMFVLRGDSLEREKSLREFYERFGTGSNTPNKERYKCLDNASRFFDNIKLTADFWITLRDNINTYDPENQLLTEQGAKWLHTLSLYTNFYWRCPLTVYFFRHRKSDAAAEDGGDTRGLAAIDNKELFADFIKQLTAYYYALFLKENQVNPIRTKTYQLCRHIYKDNQAELLRQLNSYSDEDLTPLVSKAFLDRLRVQKPLLLLDAYLSEPTQTLIGSGTKVEIEHIFPQKYDNSAYPAAAEVERRKLLESPGNKMALEKQRNIEARDGFFRKKRKAYLKSLFLAAHTLEESHKGDDFTADDIEARDLVVCQRLATFLSGRPDKPVKTTQPTAHTTFHLSRKRKGQLIEARGHFHNGQFVIERGSQLAPTIDGDAPNVCRQLRDEARTDGRGRLVEDLPCGNATQAAIVVLGIRSARFTNWVDDQGNEPAHK